MIIEKNRHMNELMKLFRSSEAVTAEELASFTDSSVRTVKNDMKYLNEELKASEGCEIVSHKGKGYSIVISDAEKADALQYKLTVLRALFGYRSIIDTNRWLFIVQTLLIYSNIKKEKLCDTLYLSESGIAPHLAKACNFLESFGIEVHSNSVHGLFIHGKEQDIRSCLVEVASSSYHEIELMYNVPEFEKMIYPNIETYQNIRHALLKILRESRMSVTDIASKKLATHLCLLKERSRLGQVPEIEIDIQKEIQETYEYSLAEDIFKDAAIFSYLGEQDEIEVINFARLLIINRDIDLKSDRDLETLLPRYIIANQKIIKKILAEMKKKSPYVSIFSMDIMQRYETDFESLMLQIYFKYYFDRLSKQRLVTYIEKDEQLLSPVAKDISRTCIECLQQEYQQPILSLETQALAELMELILKNMKYQYHKLNLALASMNGRIVGKNLRQGLISKFPDYISEVEVFDLYEMRRVNFKDFDAILIQGTDSLYLNYPCKFVIFDPLNSRIQNGSEQLFDDLFTDGYSKNILNSMKNLMNVFDDVHVESIESFFTLMCYKYARSDADRKYLHAHITERGQILSYVYSNGIGVVPIDFDHTDRECFDIYRFDHALTTDNEYIVKYMIVMCIDPKRSPQEIKEINRLVQTEIHSQESLESLIQDPEKLNENWKAVMKNQFLNGI